MKKNILTPEEFKEQMAKLARIEDQEGVHVLMDKLMCELLVNLGYEEGVEIFKATDKWYA